MTEDPRTSGRMVGPLAYKEDARYTPLHYMPTSGLSQCGDCITEHGESASFYRNTIIITAIRINNYHNNHCSLRTVRINIKCSLFHESANSTHEISPIQ